MSTHDARKQLNENGDLLRGKTDAHSLVLWNLSAALLNIVNEIESIQASLSSIESKVKSIQSKR
jgi:hypothetical protein